FAVAFVAVKTQSGIFDWFETMTSHLKSQDHEALPVFSLDPRVRVTVFTVALHMCIWHVCTHLSNQMTVQRYFSTTDAKAARRSFVTASVLNVGINLLLVTVGLALVHYYVGQGKVVEGDVVGQGRYDLVFPVFAIHQMPPGVGGAVLAALLAAAMSSIDSGINSIATVISAEREKESEERVRYAMVITAFTGVFITGAAYLLNFMPDDWGIVAALPRTFNAITGPLGGLFLIGMFLPKTGQRGAIIGVGCGLLVSIGIGYSKQIGDLFGSGWPVLSFTWVMPCSLLATLLVAWLVGDRPQHSIAGLTWATRTESSADE
ncbi:MAG: sodium:solute symporter family transporter, partial [Limisphaerales bacterium]